MELLQHWLATAVVHGLDGHRIRQLCQHLELAALIRLPASTLQQLGLTAKQAQLLCYQSQPWVEQALQWQAESPQHHLLCFDDPRYPLLLKETPHPPAVLFVKGDAELLQQAQIAMVGSRSPTPGGRQIARQFAAELSTQGMVITSGMAQGIDSESHLGALEAGGKTIAVLGHGLRQIYPVGNRALAGRIVQQGALVSEYFPDVRARAEFFPQRNRIVVGLSTGTLVVEAALRSGSLISAHLAVQYNREVFAVPGALFNTQAAGCHYLIQQGAKLVTCVADILEERALFADNGLAKTEKNPEISLSEQQLLANVGDEPIATDQLAERSGMSVTDVSIALLQLELAGRVAVVPGGYIRVRSA
ncbi:DNA-processing protein DprA [Alishewanella jeotgali]|uniref:Smf protein n=1 Tax=Alishewanella jeotgali KCTC 22429 TaxID=1129374 RepID=H3ZEQ3_9ALTE|nr:DNA-processing protein DprA [Alishewanella jeotgali]EHR41016.1 Smf protein [Alishewanella jeotgali KCTC 22429]